VQASLINTGDSGSPSYRLALRSRNLGADTIQLSDGAQSLVESLNTGRAAQYTVNGLPTPITSAGRSVTLAPGVVVDLLKATPSGQPVTITVSRDSQALESSISGFVDAFNNAVDAIDQQVGENAGVLSGQSLIYTLRKTLGSITQYTQTGTVSSIAEMGLTLDRYGKLSFNRSVFAAKDPADLQAFLGASGGGGFLGSVSATLDQVEDPVDGALPAASKLVREEISRQNDLIAENERRIDDLQIRMREQMSAADALLAQLETKKNYFTNLFTAMLNYNLNGAGVKAE
jgi:flagellar hook-associated protein 2